ncbi:MAG: hypothetical protein GX061_06370 [Eubacteriaceae bacterium]|nr:hypothetical protein [Eubacteriaceae bacterium]
MAKITGIIDEFLPATRFIGKRYSEIGHWNEWWEGFFFEKLETTIDENGGLPNWESAGGYVGMEKRREGILTDYYIGMFATPETPIPEGFICIDFDRTNLGTCVIYGKEGEVHDVLDKCRKALTDRDYTIKETPEGAVYSFENCLCPRYTDPDENGNITLYYSYFVI